MTNLKNISDNETTRYVCQLEYILMEYVIILN